MEPAEDCVHLRALVRTVLKLLVLLPES